MRVADVPSQGIRRFSTNLGTNQRVFAAVFHARVRQRASLGSPSQVARREGERFESAPWVHKAQALPKEEFKREVERHLTGRETEAWELLYFKMYKSQLAVVEQALETAGLMLGTNQSRGYCLEMICADFLAGANLDGANPEALILWLRQIYRLLPLEQQNQFRHEIRGPLCQD